MEFLAGLNPEQKAAVEYGRGPMLILAGAGSGKTRVLTHRIAHLITHHGVEPSSILAVTFTNKAAAEMRHRVSSLLLELENPPPVEALWVSTFHSTCVRILRSDIHYLGFDNHFTIYDDQDQQSVIKACLKELKITDNSFSPKAIQGRINRLKNDCIDCASYEPSYGGMFEEVFVEVFQRYTEVLRKSSAVDFGDLILLTVKLFQNFPRVLQNYQDRFSYFLIDEYQDTNKCQYMWMKLLAAQSQNLCVVGDEDQSIYGWRGADITNILNFESDFPSAKIFKLEQNYRSTKNIIEAASAVIAFNTERREKSLWTENTEGEKISLLESYDEHDEALKAVSEVARRAAEGFSLNQMAIFYRTNAQSRLLEDMLRAKGINYAMFGGLKFYERLEIKDSLAYLKLLVNPADDVSFRRIVNVPARGIGAVSLEKFSDAARAHGVSLWKMLEDCFGPDSMTTVDVGRSAKAFRSFYALMANLRSIKNSLLPSDLLNAVLEDSGYRKALIAENTVESRSRLENLAELRQSIVEYELRRGAENPQETLAIEGFLEEIALVSSMDRFDADAPAIKLMTIHMAKGLEFDLVFIVGLEEELFPNIRPWEGEEVADVEEERRLFYVGMTRARKKLFLLYAKNRTVFGNSHFRVLSRFVEEIPGKFIDEHKADYFSRRRPYAERPGLIPPSSAHSEEGFEESGIEDGYSQVSGNSDFGEGAEPWDEVRAGSRIVHPLFGEGVVRRSLGKDKLLVEFSGRGLKKISLRFSQIRIV